MLFPRNISTCILVVTALLIGIVVGYNWRGSPNKVNAIGYAPHVVPPTVRRAANTIAGTVGPNEEIKLGKNVSQTYTMTPSKEPSIADLQRQHPEFLTAWNANIHRAIRNWYGDIAAGVGLDNLTANAVSNLLMEKLRGDMDIQEILRKQGGGKINGPEYRAALRSNDDVIDNEIRGIIGDEKFKTLEQLPLVINNESEIRNQFAPEFDEQGVALSPDEIHKLAKAMVTSKPPNADSGVGSTPENGYLGADDRALLQAASEILSDVQYRILRQRIVDRNVQKYFAATRGGKP